MDVLDLRDQCLAALAHLDVDITDGEPDIDASGRIRHTVILGVTTGTATNRRAAGGSVNRDGYVNALIVTPSRDSCLWLSERARDALADMSLPGGARLTDASYDGEPLPEPDTAPARWSRALAFTATRKRNTP
jgi:hypothetical protein